MSLIPRIVHQIWFQGQNQIPVKYLAYQKSFQTLNPDFSYMLWDASSISHLIQEKESNLYDLYDTLPMMIQKIDLGKYIILKHHGGVYADMDMECLRPLSDLLNEHPEKSLIIGEMRMPLLLPFASRGKYWTGKYYNNGLIVSSKNHDFWDHVLSYIQKNIKRQWYQTSDYYVQDSTGTMAIIVPMRDLGYEKRNDVLAAPYYYFEPCDKYNQGDQSCDTSKSYVVHHKHGDGGNSWMSPTSKVLLEVYYRWEIIVIIILVLLLIIVLSKIYR